LKILPRKRFLVVRIYVEIMLRLDCVHPAPHGRHTGPARSSGGPS
jgi:hypothetical protein